MSISWKLCIFRHEVHHNHSLCVYAAIRYNASHLSSSCPYIIAVSIGANCANKPWIQPMTEAVFMTVDGSRGPAPPRSCKIITVFLGRGRCFSFKRLTTRYGKEATTIAEARRRREGEDGDESEWTGPHDNQPLIVLMLCLILKDPLFYWHGGHGFHFWDHLSGCARVVPHLITYYLIKPYMHIGARAAREKAICL